MPRITLGKDKRDDDIVGTIAKYKAIRNIETQTLMDASGIKRTSFYAKIGQPSTFTIGELRIIFDYLKVPKEERGGI